MDPITLAILAAGLAAASPLISFASRWLKRREQVNVEFGFEENEIKVSGSKMTKEEMDQILKALSDSEASIEQTAGNDA